MALEVALLECSQHEIGIQWDRYVRSHPAASGYHSLGWRRVIEQTFGYKTYYLYAQEHGEIVGVLPLACIKTPLFGRFLVSLPFTTYGGLVGAAPRVDRELLEAAVGMARSLNASHIEFRHLEAGPLELPTKSHKVTMWLDLPSSVDGLWERFRTELRTDIRKRMKEGVEVRIGGTEELGNFYRVYSTNMRDLGSPACPSEFFSTILHEWPGSAWIATAYFHGEAVASGLLLGFRDTIEIPWASSLREKRRLRPNMLLYWECLRHAIAGGFRRFDFGRSTPASGTFTFKKQWGAKPVPVHWQYWLASPDGSIPDVNPANPKFARAIQIWQRLPLWATRLLGPRLARFFP